MKVERQRPKSHLVLAALLAGAVGLALVVAGWWILDWQPRYGWDGLTDPSSWLGGLVRSAGLMLFSKTGFKAALVLVVAIVAGVAWLRSRQRRQDEPVGAGLAGTEQEAGARAEDAAG